LGKETVYSSELAVNAQIYLPSDCESVNYNYHAVEVKVIETGYYVIISNSTIYTHGLLYKIDFDGINPRLNLISENNNNPCNQQFEVITRLQVNKTYVLVVTSFSPKVTGPFLVLVTGPNNVSINHTSKYF
jgi:hypothetical protein